MNPQYAHAPAAPAVPAAPAPAPAPAPAAPAVTDPAPAAPAAPTVREFGNGLAAHKEQDDTVYRTLGRMNVACSHCGALHWIEERLRRAIVNPRFSRCCLQGKVNMPAIEPPPAELQDLFRGDTPLSRRFLAQIRIFNNAFAFASFGTSTRYRDMRQPRGRGPNTFQVKGQLYHKIGGILPPTGQQPQFAQIYFHDSDQGAEADLRLDFIYGPRNQNVQNGRGRDGAQEREKDRRIIGILQRLMYRYNPYARRFKTIGDRIRADNAPVLGLKIVCQRAGDERRYNRPTADEFAAILPGVATDAPGNRDIVIQLRDNTLHQVSALHQAYFPLCYPLLFLRGEDGFH
ncbi:hypothetical protein F5H01DRAFT_280754, partial [Linnemannia elongata]